MVIVVLLAAIGATDVLHAMNYSLRHRPTEGIVAAAPVVAVLLAFSLLLTLLRQSRSQAPRAGRRERRRVPRGSPPRYRALALPRGTRGPPPRGPAERGPALRYRGTLPADRAADARPRRRR